MVEGVARVTSSLRTLRDGSEGPWKGERSVGKLSLGSAFGHEWKEGGCLGLGDQGSVYFGTLGIEDSKVLCRAINKLKMKQIAEHQSQHISLTDCLGVMIFPEMGVFQKQRRKGGWEGGDEWGGRQLSASVWLQDSSCRCGQSNSCQFP